MINFDDLVMINFDDLAGGNKQEHNPLYRQISDHPHRVLIGGSGSGQTNILANLINIINDQPDLDKNVSCAKGLYESKYH